MLPRLTVALTLATLALLPWSWFPPFPWLHHHAQWSDACFAAAAVCWLLERLRQGVAKWRSSEEAESGLFSPPPLRYFATLPLRIRSWHGWLAAYVGCAALSLWFAAPDRRAGAWKLLGMVELALLAVIVADLAGRPRVLAWMARVVAWNALAVAAAAGVGLALFYGGHWTPLVGIYGDLPASPWYARVQAGTTNPNLLASYGIFAGALLAHEEADLPPGLRRVAMCATGLAVLLTCSRSILGFGVAAAIRAARAPRGRWAALFLSMVAAGIILALTYWNLGLDTARPFSPAARDVPTVRRQASESAWGTLVRHPVWGSGPGTSPGFAGGRPYDAHFTPLNVAATLGLPALAALAGLFAALWRARKRPTDRATWSGLAGMVLDALATDVEDFRHLWVLVGLAGRRGAEAPPAAVREDARG